MCSIPTAHRKCSSHSSLQTAGLSSLNDEHDHVYMYWDMNVVQWKQRASNIRALNIRASDELAAGFRNDNKSARKQVAWEGTHRHIATQERF